MIRPPVLTIRTPEGIAFSLLLAGPIHRFMASAIDLGCMLVLSGAIMSIIRILGIALPDIAIAIGIAGSFLIMLGYGIVLEWFWHGQTLGKRLMNLRVMDVHGLKLNFSQVAIRNLLRTVDSLPVYYMAGGICCILSPKRQRLGDIAANTVVVRTPKFVQPDISEALADKYNSFLAYPHLAARLRQRTSPEEADLALQALLRRDGLEADARVRLFGELASHFRAIVPFPEDASGWLSDEQYVRNVVEILFSQK
jgi:uncharacterized RDD family membrane protein YckC